MSSREAGRIVRSKPRHIMFAAIRSSGDILVSIVMLFVMIAGVGWILWRSLRKAEDPPRLVFKWILTVIIVGYMVRYVMPDVAQGGEGAIVGVLTTAVIGLVLAIIWRHSIAMMIAKPFGSLYDGGDDEDDPKPFYSTAKAKRMRGDFLGAKADVRAELVRFPMDMEGQMLLAEIEAQDIHDLRAAEIVVQRFIAQKGHTPANIAYALSSMADWQLKYAQDRTRHWRVSSRSSRCCRSRSGPCGRRSASRISAVRRCC